MALQRTLQDYQFIANFCQFWGYHNRATSHRYCTNFPSKLTFSSMKKNKKNKKIPLPVVQVCYREEFTWYRIAICYAFFFYMTAIQDIFCIAVFLHRSVQNLAWNICLLTEFANQIWRRKLFPVLWQKLVVLHASLKVQGPFCNHYHWIKWKSVKSMETRPVY